MAKIRWTAEAESWLKDIHDYIAIDNPEAAAAVINGIYERTQDLTRFPNLGYKYKTDIAPIRILLYEHYRIAYIVKQNGDIDILGVFHGALEIDRYLF